jgi:serine/threonine protein kinase
MSMQYNFERDVLQRCGERRLSRVVSVLDAGVERVPGTFPNAVSYLILELADGDARDLLDLSDPADCLARLQAAHHAAVGLNQLHKIGVHHQDSKPANLLTWRNPDVSAWESKLGDLGSAHDATIVGPHDDLLVAGDPAYAAPELLYDDGPIDIATWRSAADMYAFGSLLSFLVCGVSFNGLQSMYLNRDLHWRDFGGTYDEVKAHLLEAHSSVADRLRDDLHVEVAEDVTRMLSELCHPEPSRRGDRVALRRGGNQYSFERYISALALLIKRIPVRRAMAG